MNTYLFIPNFIASIDNKFIILNLSKFINAFIPIVS